MPKKKLNKNLVKAKKIKDWLEGRFNSILKDYFLIDYVKLSFRYPNEHGHSSEPDRNLIFQTHYMPEYHRANITIFPNVISLYDNHRKDLIEGMFHELSHLHSSKLQGLCSSRYTSQEEVDKASEDLTEIIAQYILRSAKDNKEGFNKLIN